MREQDLPAFPCNENVPINCAGLSKREYFAAIAMQGILASGIVPSHKPVDDFQIIVARRSLEFANAILLELERT